MKKNIKNPCLPAPRRDPPLAGKIKNGKSSAQMTIIAMVFLAVLLLGGTSFVSYSNISSKKVHQSVGKEEALQLADAGIKKAVFGLNADAGYNGETFTLGRGVVTVSLQTVDENTKKIVSIGYIPNATSTIYKRKIETLASLDRPTIDSPFHFAMQAGTGGIIMGGNSTIEGSMYSNGSILGSSGAKITGDAFVANDIPVHVALDQITQDSTTAVGSQNQTEDWMQSFIMPETGNITKVEFLLRKIGVPNSTAVGVASDNNGKPGTLIASAPLDTAGAPEDFAWYGVMFANQPLFYQGKKYWIVIDVSNASAVKHWEVRSAADTAYPDGTTEYGTEWSVNNPSLGNVDFAFKITTALANKMKTATIGENGKGTAKAPTIENSTIAADAHAKKLTGSVVGNDAYVDTCTSGTVGRNVYYSVSNSCTTGGSSVGGQSSPELPGFADLPIDADTIDKLKEDAGANVHNGDYEIKNGATKWLGPLEITGNLKVENGGTLIVEDTIYVRGNIEFRNNCIVNLGPDFGKTAGAIVVDGKTAVSNNCEFGTLSPGGYVLVVSTDKDVDFTAPSFDINNNADTVIFYAPFGSVLLANNVIIREATGSVIKLENNATVVYEEGLASLQVTSGPAAEWKMDKGSWRVTE